MKKLIIFTGILLAIAATGCKKSGLGDNPVAGTDTREDISFGSVVINKAFSGESKMTFSDGFSFTVNDLLKVDDAAESAHIDKDYIVYASDSGTWTYGSTKTYQWKNGTHTFFGWSKNDGFIDANTFWGSAPALNGRTLTLPTKVLTTADKNQFDFLYSDILKTTAADWKSSHDKEATVPLAFNHLFSAVSMTLENLVADKSVTVKSVKLTDTFKNSGSATITFGDPAASGETATKVVVLPTAATSTTPYIAATAITEGTLATGAKIDILDQKALAADGTPKFGLVWPQTFDGNGKELEVVYKREGDAGYTTSKLSIPATTWEPGYKYKYNLQITPNDIVLTFNVLPWESVDGLAGNTSTGSINMSNVTWIQQKVVINDAAPVNTVINSKDGSVTLFYVTPTSKEVDGKEVPTTLIDGEPVTEAGYIPAYAFFTVNYPLEGTYELSLIRAKDATDDSDLEFFEISTPETYPNLPVIEKNGKKIPQTIYFSVRAKMSTTDDNGNTVTVQDGKEHKASINLHITPKGGEKISAYSEIRANYTLIIPATSTN